MERHEAQKRIAKLMSLSLGTINNHSANLMRKLDIHDRVELALFAIREGLVPVRSKADSRLAAPPNSPVQSVVTRRIPDADPLSP